MDITVITPFHNVEMEVFEACFQSMINQTIGIDNIEWIIVLHNCEQVYIDAVREKVKPYRSVVTYVLNNEARTPSSPRNYGLTKANGKYIGFLDGDDSYITTCLETALAWIKETNAEILCVRREYEMENSNQLPIAEGMLLDKSRDVLEINRYNWEAEKTFVSVWGMVTSKIYSHDFLKRNQIFFDEEIPFSEDAAFNLICYSLASNICYLPKYVGYHYYINSASLVQCSAKDAKTLISYAKGFDKVFRTGMKRGIFMNNMIGGLLYHTSRFLEVSDIDTASRREIRDILLPYLRIVKPFDVCEIYTEEDVKLRYDYPKKVIPEVFAVDVWEDDSKKEYSLTTAQIYQKTLMESCGRGIEAIELDRYYELDSSVDEERLRKAVQETLCAHDIYRIRVKDHVMRISDDMPVTALYYFTDKLFREYRSACYHRPIDSVNESPIQADIICCVEDFSDYDPNADKEQVGKKYLHIKASHYVYDQASLCHLFDEITHRYNGDTAGIQQEKLTVFDLSEANTEAEGSEQIEAAEQFFKEQYEGRGNGRILEAHNENTIVVYPVFQFYTAEELDKKVWEKNLTTGIFLFGMFEKTVAEMTGKTDFTYLLLTDDRADETRAATHGVLAKGVYITSSLPEIGEGEQRGEISELPPEYFRSILYKAKSSISHNILDFSKLVKQYSAVNSLMALNYIGKNKYQHRLFGKEMKHCFSREHAAVMKAFSALNLSIEKTGNAFQLVALSDSLNRDEMMSFIRKFEDNVKNALN